MQELAGNRRKMRWVLAGIAGLVLCAMVLRQLAHYDIAVDALNLFCSLARAGIYIGIIIAWGVSIRRRVLHSALRRYLLGISGFLLFWFLARTCKYLFLEGMVLPQYFCWYSYYIPMLMIPLLGIFLAASLGKPEGYVLPMPVRLLLIPAIALVLLVLTNHLHQLVFAFPEGMNDADGAYIHEPLYFVCLAWMGLEVLAFLLILLWNSHVPGRKKRLWLPVLPVGTAILYTAGYLMHIDFVYWIAGDMTAVFTLMMLATCEACIRTGLIPSNSRYDELFKASTIGAQIVDEDYNRCFASDVARVFPAELMRRTEVGPVDLGSERICGAKIRAGHVIWTEDISKIRDLLQKLEQIGSRLSENNNLLRGEVELKERQAQAEEQMRLYDKITQEVAPQLEKLEWLLEPEDDPRKLRENLAQICVLSSYIKRRGNLILLAEEASFLPARELEYCMRESVENLRRCGVASSLACRCDGILSKDAALDAYGFFQQILEGALPGLAAILVNLNVEGERVQMTLSLPCEADGSFLRSIDCQKCSGKVMVTEEEGDTILTYLLPKGGERL